MLRHVKTYKIKKRYQLLGKTRFTLGCAPRVWIAIEHSTYRGLVEGLDLSIGIITYGDKGDKASNFIIKCEPKRPEPPKYLMETQDLINKKFSTIIETSQNIFVCSVNRDNLEICKKYRIWGSVQNRG
jgi:hypothetical protein